MANATQELDILKELELFFYTPYGVSTVAGVAILLTSLLWCIGCCIYCCYQRGRNSRNTVGTLEANREMEYIGVSTLPSSQEQQHRDGTMSSGYSTANTLNSQAGTKIT